MRKHRPLIYFFCGFILISGLLLNWLVSDDPEVIYSTDLASYAPLPQDGEKGYNLLLEICRVNVDVDNLPDDQRLRRGIPESVADFHQRLINEAPAIKDSYQKITTARSIIRQLSQMESIGDPTLDATSPLINLSRFRNITLILCQQAELSVLEGNPDDSLATLLDWYHILVNWIGNTRPQVHSMMTLISINKIQTTLNRMLLYLSQEQIEMLQKRVTGDVNFFELVKHAPFCEYAFTANMIDKLIAEGNPLLPFLLRRNQTLNSYGEHVSKQLDLIEGRQWKALELQNKEYEARLLEVHLSNHYGWKLLSMAVPANTRFFKIADELTDQRNALREKINL